MSNTPIAENGLPAEDPRQTEEESTWFDRLLQSFGLGEEPDLRELIEDALARSKSDTLSLQERSMMRRILQFGKLTVEDVMVPRADIIAVDESISVDELMRASHSIKGAARIVHVEPAVRVAHALEDCFVAAQNRRITLRRTAASRCAPSTSMCCCAAWTSC